jgi:hypothetical protein
MEEAGKHLPVLSAHTYPSHIHRNVLKQRKEAKQATAVLDTVPQTIMPPKKSITIPPPIPDNPPRKAKALALTSNGQSKPNHIDLLRKRERLFRVDPIFLCLQLALTLHSV